MPPPVQVERGEAGGPHPLDQRGDGRLAGRRAADVLGEQHPAEAHLAAQHEVVAPAVPHQRLAVLDLVGERVDQLVGVERRAEADAGVVPLAVEVGGDDEPLVGQRVVRRGPRARRRCAAGTGPGWLRRTAMRSG